MSDSDSDSDSSSSESEEQTKVVPKVVVKKDADSDSDSDSDSSDSEEKTKVVAKKVAAKKEEDSDSDSESDSEEKKPAPKKALAPAKDDDSDSDSDSSDSEDEKPAEKTKEVAKTAAAKEDSDSDSDSDSEDEDKKKKPKAAKAAAKKDDDSDSDSDDEKEEAKPAAEEVPEKMEVEPKKEEEKVEEMEVDHTPSLEKTATLTPLFVWNVSEGKQKGKKRKLESSASSPQAAKKAKSEVTTTEPAAPAAPTPANLVPTKEFNPSDFKNSHLKGVSKSVFIKGIDTNAFEADIIEFFSDIEKPLQVRHKWFEDRAGIAFIEFSSPEVATKVVIDKNFEYIKDRYINTDWSEERKKSFTNRPPKNIGLKDTTNRVWVGNLHREVQDDNVVEFFKSVGELTDVYIIGRDESRPKIAYVSFTSNELATKAVESLQGTLLMDFNVRLDWAEPRQNSGAGNRTGGRKRELTEKPEDCVTCFVGRLSDTVDDDQLKELFKDAGEISQIRYLERDGEFTGSAFVEFIETSCTDKAVELNGSSFLGRQIRVDFAANSNKRERY